jgi:soluble epoxide hydrolase/lipid-phosphate phosphatase
MLSFQLVLLASAFIVHAASDRLPFRPREYPKQVSTCKALKGDSLTVDIDIHYVDINRDAKASIIMVHGWPSLWSSWANQIRELEKDHHLVIPDLRGFGSSTHPGDSQGNMGDFVSDLVCVLQHAKVATAICVGHDWGSQICHEAARMRPDIVTGVVGISIPYLPSSGPFVPIADLLGYFPRLTYQLFFDKKTPAAVKELDADIRRTLRATLRTRNSPTPDAFLTSHDSFLSAWDSVADIMPIPFFSPEEEDYFVEEYSIQGFRNTLQFYIHSNRYASWTLAHNQGNHTIPQPVLSIIPLNDPVGDWILAGRLMQSHSFLPKLTLETFEGSHWVHLEQPDEVNAAIRRWLDGISQAPGAIQQDRVPDEL